MLRSAAEQALSNQASSIIPTDPAAEPWPPDARGYRAVSELHWLTAAEAPRAFAARTLSPVEL